MASPRGLSRLLRAGLLTSIALLSIGVATGLEEVSLAGLLALALTPAAGLAYAGLILAREEGGLAYAALAVLNALMIVLVVVYYA